MKRIAAAPATRAVPITVNGQAVMALDGDTLLSALVGAGMALRHSEFTGRARAGFCLMGACQECWVTIDGSRARACTTLVQPQMRIQTDAGQP